ncbi:hypothetical protein [Streptomyces sp. NPDC002588]|uniref:hypothetical protein n=1 Tax=Streptomyces sp. NPDC002588 TaxID=3154419 RepID=UPI0033339D68
MTIGSRTLSGCIPPLLVSRLLELGHAVEVGFQAGRGEWFCAREWAYLLGGQGRQAEALETVAPYVATGWWPATRAEAELLEGWGGWKRRSSGAGRTRRRESRLALEFFARLPARHDRGGEAFTLPRAGIDDWFPRRLSTVMRLKSRD